MASDKSDDGGKAWTFMGLGEAEQTFLMGHPPERGRI